MANHSQAQANQWNAQDYAKNSSAQEGWANELIVKLMLQGNESLLDIGCGDGRITRTLAQRLSAGEVVGIDSSESMVALAKSFAGSHLSFYVMDATAIQLDKRFDIAFSNAALHWVKDHQAVLAGLKTHLKPGAKILFQMGGKGNARGIVSSMEYVISSGKWREFFEEFDFPYYFYDIEDYQQWLPAAGYQAKRIELIPKDMVHKNPDELKGWVRATWFPYTHRLPNDLREPFLTEWIESYIEKNPVDANGQTHVEMMRLEVEAQVP